MERKQGIIDANNNKIQDLKIESQMPKIPQKALTQQSKKNAKCKKIVNQNIQDIQDTMKRLNLWIIGIDKNEDLQLKGPANIFN